MAILLIEPDKTLSNVYRQAFASQGHDTIASKSAAQAIGDLDANDIKLVVIEIQMARHNGLEFIYEMRSYPEWNKIPIIINSFVPLTNFDTSKNNSTLELCKISEIFYKPETNLRLLLESVNKHIQK